MHNSIRWQADGDAELLPSEDEDESQSGNVSWKPIGYSTEESGSTSDEEEAEEKQPEWEEGNDDGIEGVIDLPSCPTTMRRMVARMRRTQTRLWGDSAVTTTMCELAVRS